MAQTSKIENLEKVRMTVKKLDQDFFTNHDIVKKTGLNYNQVKKFLNTMVDMGELKFSETTKIYMRC
jgi:hypothetical protein